MARAPPTGTRKPLPAASSPRTRPRPAPAKSSGPRSTCSARPGTTRRPASVRKCRSAKAAVLLKPARASLSRLKGPRRQAAPTPGSGASRAAARRSPIALCHKARRRQAGPSAPNAADTSFEVAADGDAAAVGSGVTALPQGVAPAASRHRSDREHGRRDYRRRRERRRRRRRVGNRDVSAVPTKRRRRDAAGLRGRGLSSRHGPASPPRSVRSARHRSPRRPSGSPLSHGRVSGCVAVPASC